MTANCATMTRAGAGPRCHTMLAGERKAALDVLLDMATVVMMTQVCTWLTRFALCGHCMRSRPASLRRGVMSTVGAWVLRGTGECPCAMTDVRRAFLVRCRRRRRQSLAPQTPQLLHAGSWHDPTRARAGPS